MWLRALCVFLMDSAFVNDVPLGVCGQIPFPLWERGPQPSTQQLPALPRLSVCSSPSEEEEEEEVPHSPWWTAPVPAPWP